jgi:hypothetical protein
MPGWQRTHRFTGLPTVAGGTDVIGGAPVRAFGAYGATLTQNFGVIPNQYASQPILGVARASAQNGKAVTIKDMPDVEIAKNGTTATIAAGALIGVASFGTFSGASGTCIEPIIGEVSGTAKKIVWVLGEALETGQPGANFSYRLNPRQITGLE